MGKSLTHKISKDAKKSDKASSDKKGKWIWECLGLIFVICVAILQKPKKTAGSIQKEKKQKAGDYDELKQLLNLEPPKINLSAFDKMGISANKEKIKSKKLSVKRRRTMKLREIYAKSNVLDENPKTLLDKQVESIQKVVSNKEQTLSLSRGQKKRLKNKVNKFASK